MADQRKGGISWTSETWNPIRGCSRVSEGCRNCYAERVAATRLSAPGRPYHGLAVMTASGPRWTGKVELVQDKLLDPLRWDRPRLIFVNSMSDLFHEALTFEQIDQVVAVMMLAWWHTFQVLTKRVRRMREYLDSRGGGRHLWPVCQSIKMPGKRQTKGPGGWPLAHVWWGASMEDQGSTDARLEDLRACRRHATVLWISLEPMIGPVDFTPPQYRGSNINQDAWLQDLDWMVVGGESGPDARPMDPAWVRTVRDRCRNRTDMGRPWPLPFFMKQLVVNGKLTKTVPDFPADLRIQEWPRRAA